MISTDRCHDVANDFPTGFADSRIFDEARLTNQLQTIPCKKVAFDLFANHWMHLDHSAVDINNRFVTGIVFRIIDSSKGLSASNMFRVK
jgi:hypothetical protein